MSYQKFGVAMIAHASTYSRAKTLLTFTPKEFASFTEKVAECYCVQSQPNENSLFPPVSRFNQIAVLYFAILNIILSEVCGKF